MSVSVSVSVTVTVTVTVSVSVSESLEPSAYFMFPVHLATGGAN